MLYYGLTHDCVATGARVTLVMLKGILKISAAIGISYHSAGRRPVPIQLAIVLTKENTQWVRATTVGRNDKKKMKPKKGDKKAAPQPGMKK